MEPKGRFLRFNPTINAGHILTAGSVILASLLAWAQLRSDVTVLLEENKQRKIDIIAIDSRREADRNDMYQRLSLNQTNLHDEVSRLSGDITTRLNRIEDKLDRKEDKPNGR